MSSLNIWGSVEYSMVNSRPDDLKSFKDLGLSKLFYPCLWQEVAPKDLDHCEWHRIDSNLEESKKLKIEIIANFSTNGSGPHYSSLIDPDFPHKFAIYARHFANRYPWINDFTPITDITLTERKYLNSELYFLKAVMHQCRGTILAMREIRIVNPKARLILSEGIGRWQSSSELESVRSFEDEKQWLAIDLITGKVRSDHPLYTYIKSHGIRDEELEWFIDHSIRPNIIGINYFLEFNRYIDHKIELYPDLTDGKNSEEQLINVCAHQTGQAEVVTISDVIKAAWDRYKTPIAVTQSHLKNISHHEAHMRWLNQIRKETSALLQEGIEIEAITASNLLGTYDLNQRKKTILSKMIKEIISGVEPSHPLLKSEGVWETPRRIQWGTKFEDFTRLYHKSHSRPVLIIGSETVLGQRLSTLCGARNIHFKSIRRREMDITDQDSIEEGIELHKPWAIINTLMLSEGPSALKLAKLCREKKISLVHFSNDIQGSYKEKEIEILNLYPESLIIRSGSSAYVPALMDESLNLLIDQEQGIIHLAQSRNLRHLDIPLTALLISQRVPSELRGQL